MLSAEQWSHNLNFTRYRLNHADPEYQDQQMKKVQEQKRLREEWKQQIETKHSSVQPRLSSDMPRYDVSGDSPRFQQPTQQQHNHQQQPQQPLPQQFAPAAAAPQPQLYPAHGRRSGPPAPPAAQQQWGGSSQQLPPVQQMQPPPMMMPQQQSSNNSLTGEQLSEVMHMMKSLKEENDRIKREVESALAAPNGRRGGAGGRSGVGGARPAHGRRSTAHERQRGLSDGELRERQPMGRAGGRGGSVTSQNQNQDGGNANRGRDSRAIAGEGRYGYNSAELDDQQQEEEQSSSTVARPPTLDEQVAGVTDEEILQCFYSYMEPELSSYRKITILIGGFKRKWGGSRRNPTGSKWRAKMYEKIGDKRNVDPRAFYLAHQRGEAHIFLQSQAAAATGGGIGGGAGDGRSTNRSGQHSDRSGARPDGAGAGGEQEQSGYDAQDWSNRGEQRTGRHGRLSQQHQQPTTRERSPLPPEQQMGPFGSGGRWDGLSKAELYTILMEKRQEKVNVLGVSTGAERAALMGPGSVGQQIESEIAELLGRIGELDVEENIHQANEDTIGHSHRQQQQQQQQQQRRRRQQPHHGGQSSPRREPVSILRTSSSRGRSAGQYDDGYEISPPPSLEQMGEDDLVAMLRIARVDVRGLRGDRQEMIARLRGLGMGGIAGGGAGRRPSPRGGYNTADGDRYYDNNGNGGEDGGSPPGGGGDYGPRTPTRGGARVRHGGGYQNEEDEEPEEWIEPLGQHDYGRYDDDDVRGHNKVRVSPTNPMEERGLTGAAKGEYVLPEAIGPESKLSKSGHFLASQKLGSTGGIRPNTSHSREQTPS